MRKVQYVISSVIVFVLFITLTGTVTAAPPARAKWTVMVYISGDNNLEDYVVKDLELELAPTGSNADVQVLIHRRLPEGPGRSKCLVIFPAVRGESILQRSGPIIDCIKQRVEAVIHSYGGPGLVAGGALAGSDCNLVGSHIWVGSQLLQDYVIFHAIPSHPFL